VESPREIVHPGDEIRVKILEIDSERRRLSLSAKRVEDQILPISRPGEPSGETGVGEEPSAVADAPAEQDGAVEVPDEATEGEEPAAAIAVAEPEAIVEAEPAAAAAVDGADEPDVGDSEAAVEETAPENAAEQS
jgi:small subunit ribosomal protein S1